LQLLEKLTNGSIIDISHTGTSVTFRPGVIVGGDVSHDCQVTRGIGYFLEPLVAIAPFSKFPFKLTLTGITNNNLDVSADSIRTALLPHLKHFGIDSNIELKIKKRGAPPLGGGEVYFSCPIVEELKPIKLIEPGRVKRIRGIAYCTRVSPQMANRIMESSRSLLTRYIPDVYVYTDVYKGTESGKSPGYGLTLVAETTTGMLISAECAFQPRSENDKENDLAEFHFPTPEDLGVRAARLLLKEIGIGGCVDTTHQWLPILMAALGPEDVSKIRLGTISQFTIQYLRDMKELLGVTFKVDQDRTTHTILLTCVGSGFVNLNRRVA
jgi:RNA 3'-terminal phosphate cyclase-like protein